LNKDFNHFEIRLQRATKSLDFFQRFSESLIFHLPQWSFVFDFQKKLLATAACTEDFVFPLRNRSQKFVPGSCEAIIRNGCRYSASTIISFDLRLIEDRRSYLIVPLKFWSCNGVGGNLTDENAGGKKAQCCVRKNMSSYWGSIIHHSVLIVARHSVRLRHLWHKLLVALEHVAWLLPFTSRWGFPPPIMLGHVRQPLQREFWFDALKHGTNAAPTLWTNSRRRVAQPQT